jgi:hypothetical protein
MDNLRITPCDTQNMHLSRQQNQKPFMYNKMLLQGMYHKKLLKYYEMCSRVKENMKECAMKLFILRSRNQSCPALT